MNTECSRIARELADTVGGDAWYGDSLREILGGVTAEQARAHPIPNAHSIWELVLHLDAWIGFFSRAVEGAPIPQWPGMRTDQDFPPVAVADEASWKLCVDLLLANHSRFAEMIQRFGDDRLESTVPGRTYNFNRMFQSASLHAAYHGGQIALLKKMLK